MKKMIHSDHHARSIIKAVTYRITGTVTTILISYFVTRQLKWAFSIGLADVITKIIVYYLHERAWNRIKFGKKSSDLEYNI